MMYVGLRIKTPSAPWLKQFCTYDNTQTYYSFLYNYKVKNEETGEYEIAERYIVNVMNIVPNADSDIVCTKILKCKPIIKKDKNGKEYLNCDVYIEAENVAKPKLSRYQDNVNQKNSNMISEQQKQNQNNNQNQYSNDNLSINENDLPF